MDLNITVKVKKISNEAVPLPLYATSASAGLDLCAALPEPFTLQPGDRVKIPTGLAMELPGPEVVALIFARSGLAGRYGLGLSNGVGVVDSDYRGEIQVLIHNLGQEPFVIHPGDRIAQMLFMPVFQARLEEVSDLQETERGTGGFGSTGVGL